MDIRKESNHKKLNKYLIRKKFNNIDCIINCAGYSKWSPIEKVIQQKVPSGPEGQSL